MSTWKVYAIDDCDWYMARSLDEAVAFVMELTGETREGVLLNEPRELTEADLLRLEFTDDSKQPPKKRTFREQLDAQILEYPFPQYFATTEG